MFFTMCPVQHDELESSLKGSGLLVQTQKTNHLEVRWKINIILRGDASVYYADNAVLSFGIMYEDIGVMHVYLTCNISFEWCKILRHRGLSFVQKYTSKKLICS